MQHADGSRAIYFHMKSGRITIKAIGQNTTAGEVIGIVGCSGYFSGPHLHFEV
ncbi:MAG: M23 family metallopeptidase [Saprospiraceae bacterium]|nr:M23 family metallopeptidase [Candidatus Vicinibacter proximus]MBL7822791.1 M23 family metallopeptidase [Saprospiraceae bacterium]MCC6843226.1 M23 family metallopeptidase [Saprospiraceae bacterium]